MKQISLMLTLVVFLSSCVKMNDGDIALVGGNPVTKQEMGFFISEANLRSLDRETREEKLEDICRQYQTRYFLEETGDLDSGDIYWEKQVWSIKNLANRAYQEYVVNAVWTPEREKTQYNKLQKVFKPSHILISYKDAAGKSKNGRSKEEAEALAKKLLSELTAENFAETAQKFSDDAGSRNRGGALSWGSSGQWVDPFEDAVYSMAVGDIAGPIESQFGYHIIKLDDARTQQLPPLEEYRQDLKQSAFNLYRNEFQERHEFIFDSLATAFPLEYNDSLLADFMDRYTRLSENVFYSKQFTPYDIMDIFADSLTVGYMGNIPINKNWIIRYLKVVSLQVPPRFESLDHFKDFVEDNQAGSILYNEALKMNLDKQPDYIIEENVYLAKKSFGLFDKLYVYEKINPSDEQLSAFYESHKDSLYRVPEKVKVQEILLSDSAFAATLKDKIAAGEDMGILAEKYSVRNIGSKNQGHIPPFKKTQYGKMGSAAFSMENGEIGGPFKVGKHYSIIRKIETLPASYKTEKQVKYRLLTDYRSEKIINKREDVYRMLDKKYPVKLNRDLINE